MSVIIRFNLDPAGKHSDSELHRVLEKVGISSGITSLDEPELKLSPGQKQLLCIARALLSNTKVVFIDEGTSNMDPETASSVDSLLASEFSDATVFIVTHRMSVLNYCDGLLLLQNGQVMIYEVDRMKWHEW